MKSVNDYIDKHKNKLGFVVGAGPSLHNIDVSLLKKYIIFSVNSSLPKVSFANYFVADDIGVKNWDYYVDLLPSLNCVSFLYKDKLEKYASHLDKNKIVWFKHKWWYDSKNKKYNPKGLVMNKQEPIIGARTTAGSAVHLAYIMGCDPIVLLGCDCCYEGSRRYYWQFKGEKPCHRTTGEQVFSTPNKGKKEGKPVDSHSLDFLEYWDALGKQIEKQSINVINSSGGLIKSFPRMSLKEILNKYGEQKS